MKWVLSCTRTSNYQLTPNCTGPRESHWNPIPVLRPPVLSSQRGSSAASEESMGFGDGHEERFGLVTLLLAFQSCWDLVWGSSLPKEWVSEDLQQCQDVSNKMLHHCFRDPLRSYFGKFQSMFQLEWTIVSL